MFQVGQMVKIIDSPYENKKFRPGTVHEIAEVIKSKHSAFYYLHTGTKETLLFYEKELELA